MKKYKDEQLDALFGTYLEEGKNPDSRVTEKAKRALEERRSVQTVWAAEPAPVGSAATGHTASVSHMSKRRKAETGILAAVLGCALLLLGWILCLQLFSSKTIVLNWSQLSKVTGTVNYEQKDFLPFVSEDSVNQYDEYELNEESPYYEEYEGDIVLYYVQFESYGVMVDIFIEVPGFELDSLDGYLEIDDYYGEEEPYLYLAIDEEADRTYAYFSFDIYSYYLEIYTAEESLVYDIMVDIIYSF